MATMKWLVFLACMSSLFVACLGTPDTPRGRPPGDWRQCGAPNEYPLDPSCRQKCNVTHDCPTDLWCSYTDRDYYSVCVDYSHCSYLGSDTQCAQLEKDDPTSCVGNAQWHEEALYGDPACGRAHDVLRCQPTPNGCTLVAMTAYDLATP
ncbi:hypothetical protein LZC95_50715 [Pendulispora brunnea]|uniref:Uncharacterized protein n=1 Tax=Pendulispora brunnea TaxID=2905690 RepID=A0ABZ2K7L7_9BACT